MANLAFRVIGVEASARGLTPFLQFKLEIKNEPESARIQALLLRVQIQIQSAQRPYNAAEKDRLSEVFGSPDRWGTTLRNKLWTHVDTNLPAFTGRAEVRLSVPCTYDLNVAAAKYFYALEGGEVSLLFLFSGTVFYSGDDGRLQIEQIPWEKECTFAMPIQRWRELLDHHYPNSAWIDMQRDVFERLYKYKRSHGLTDWDQTIERILSASECELAKGPA